MVFYFRSWHWSCCWLLLLIACCCCLLDDCWLRLGYCCCCCCWLLLMATAWILVMDDCWSRLGYYLLIGCWRKSFWIFISQRRWGNLGELGQLTVGKRMKSMREYGVYIPCYIAIEQLTNRRVPQMKVIWSVAIVWILKKGRFLHI